MSPSARPQFSRETILARRGFIQTEKRPSLDLREPSLLPQEVT